MPKIDHLLEVQRRNHLGRYAFPLKLTLGMKLDVTSGTATLVKPDTTESLKGGGVRITGNLVPTGHIKGILPLVDQTGTVRGFAAVYNLRGMDGSQSEQFIGYSNDKNPQGLQLRVTSKKKSFIRRIIEALDNDVLGVRRVMKGN